MQYFTECCLLICRLALSVLQFLSCFFNSLLYYVSGTSSAIVVKEVISIRAVIGLSIDFEESCQCVFLLFRQVELLFIHLNTKVVGISSEERIGMVNRKDIVGFTLYKIVDEIIASAVEHSVIVDEVVVRIIHISHPDCSVSEHLIGIWPRVTSNKSDIELQACGIRFCLYGISRFWSLCF